MHRARTGSSQDGALPGGASSSLQGARRRLALRTSPRSGHPGGSSSREPWRALGSSKELGGALERSKVFQRAPWEHRGAPESYGKLRGAPKSSGEFRGALECSAELRRAVESSREPEGAFGWPRRGELEPPRRPERAGASHQPSLWAPWRLEFAPLPEAHRSTNCRRARRCVHVSELLAGHLSVWPK
eukprot:11848525-Alexandrium_andersonii.AAC.1